MDIARPVALLCALTLPHLTGDAPQQGRGAAASVSHEQLAVLEGTWTRERLQPGESFRETCAWMAGAHRHMVCRQSSSIGDRAREQMAVYSYRRADAMFSVSVFLAGGQVWRYEGQFDGKGWVFAQISDVPDPPLRLRQLLTPGENTLHFREEVSEKGGPWRLTDPSEEYGYVRVR